MIKDISQACKDLQALRGYRDYIYAGLRQSGGEKAVQDHFAPYGDDQETGCLKVIQDLLREKLDVEVIAYGGSIALYLQGHAARYGDLDIYTDRQFKQSDIEAAGIPVDAMTPVGWQSHNLNLDIFFTESARSAAHLEMGRNHVIQLDSGIYVQDADYILGYNWRFLRNDAKRRPMKESTHV